MWIIGELRVVCSRTLKGSLRCICTCLSAQPEHYIIADARRDIRLCTMQSLLGQQVKASCHGQSLICKKVVKKTKAF